MMPVSWYTIAVETLMQSNARKQGCFARDMLEWNVPDEVLEVLLKDSAIERKHI